MRHIRFRLIDLDGMFSCKGESKHLFRADGDSDKSIQVKKVFPPVVRHLLTPPVFLICLTLTQDVGAVARREQVVLISDGKKIHMEARCGTTSSNPAAIIFLHGSGGPSSGNLPYADEESDFVSRGFCIFLPHYLDATGGVADSPAKEYPTWVQVIEDTAKYISDNHGIPRNRIALVGYSLGASVALGAAANNPTFAAVVEFSGSLPDRYVSSMTTLPPLLIVHGREDSFIPVVNALQLAELCKMKAGTCDVELYPGEGHFFSMGTIIRAKKAVEVFLMAHVPVG